LETGPRACRIEVNPAVLQGKPVGRDDIQAALRYAADSVAHELIVLRVPGPDR